MEFDFTQASLQEILNYTPDFRREAYIDATLRMQADDNIDKHSLLLSARRLSTAAALYRFLLSVWMPLFLNTAIIPPAMQSKVRWCI